MFDQQDGDDLFLLDVTQQAVQFFGLARVEAGGRFVETQQHGLGAHGAGDFEAPLGAIGQVARRIVGAVDEPDLLQPVRRQFDGLLVGFPVDAGAEDAAHRIARGPHQSVVLRHHKVLENRHAGKQPDVLKGPGNMGALRNAEIIHPLEQKFITAIMLQDDAAFGRLVEAGDAVEHRGLAGTVGADQRRDIIALGLEREIADGCQSAKTHRQVFDPEQRRGRILPHQP